MKIEWKLGEIVVFETGFAPFLHLLPTLSSTGPQSPLPTLKYSFSSSNSMEVRWSWTFPVDSSVCYRSVSEINRLPHHFPNIFEIIARQLPQDAPRERKKHITTLQYCTLYTHKLCRLADPSRWAPLISEFAPALTNRQPASQLLDVAIRAARVETDPTCTGAE